MKKNKNDYLKLRNEEVVVKPTDGKWDRQEQRNYFAFLDRNIEKYGCVGSKDRKTMATKAYAFNLLDSKKYKAVILNEDLRFFKNLVQCLKIISNNSFLVKEIFSRKKKVLLPFISNSKKDKNGKPSRFIMEASWTADGQDLETGISVFKFKDDVSIFRPELDIIIILPED